MFLGHQLQLGIEFRKVFEAIRVEVGQRGAVTKENIATQTVLPVLRQVVPPVAKGFLLVDFGGVDARNLKAVVIVAAELFHSFCKGYQIDACSSAGRT